MVQHSAKAYDTIFTLRWGGSVAVMRGPGDCYLNWTKVHILVQIDSNTVNPNPDRGGEHISEMRAKQVLDQC